MKIRAIVAIVAAVIGTLLFAPAAQSSASPGAPAYPPTNCPGKLSVSTTHPLPGATITVTGTGFTPGAKVHLVMHSKVYDLGTFTANAQGSFTAQVTLPDGVSGAHVVFATSGAPNIHKCPGDSIQIQPPSGESTGPGGPPGTSFTGVDILLILSAAAVLLCAGYAFNRSGKRRQAGHI